jgi:HEPN domain-containing protein
MNDQPKHLVETSREWLRYAEQDQRVAEQAMGDDLPAFHTICFLCQSAAKKFLKGYLIAPGWTLEKTHDIVALLGVCVDYDAEWGAMAAVSVYKSALAQQLAANLT